MTDGIYTLTGKQPIEHATCLTDTRPARALGFVWALLCLGLLMAGMTLAGALTRRLKKEGTYERI